jgi:predicted transcriptional regulator
MARRKPKKQANGSNGNGTAVAKQSVSARLTQYEIAERRKNVERLRLRGLSVTAIAKLLKVEVWTVSKDLKAVQEQNIKEVNDFDQSAAVAEAMSRYREIEERAWAEYSSADSSRERLKALDLLRVTQGDKLKALADTGLIHKEPVQLEVKHTHQLDWTPEMRDNVARALLYQGLTPQLAEPTLDEAEIIEVEAIETGTLNDDDEQQT